MNRRFAATLAAAAVFAAMTLAGAGLALAADAPTPIAPVVPVATPTGTPAATPSGTTATSTEAAPAAPEPGLLMQGLDPLSLKKPLDDAGVNIFGWVEGGFMGRLTGGQNPLPGRTFDGARPNNALLDQLRLTIARSIDPSKTFDMGGRVDFLYGSDARATHSLGLLQHAVDADELNQIDLTQLYAEWFFGKGNKDTGEGLDVIVGKFVTPLGAEVIDAPGNPLYSHSYLFNYAIPFTHTGVKANYTFGPQASAYVAMVRGWDTFNDNNNGASIMVGGALNSSEQVGGNARASLGLNIITGPEQSSNTRDYRTVIDLVGTYRWNEKLTQIVNFDYGTEQHADGPEAAQWYGVAHYLTYAFTDSLAGTWRAEWFRDPEGIRFNGGGTAGNFYEMTWGLTITPCPTHPIFKNLSLRPELRWDFSDNSNAFGGDHSNQLTAGFDIIFKF